MRIDKSKALRKGYEKTKSGMDFLSTTKGTLQNNQIVTRLPKAKKKKRPMSRQTKQRNSTYVQDALGF